MRVSFTYSLNALTLVAFAKQEKRIASITTTNHEKDHDDLAEANLGASSGEERRTKIGSRFVFFLCVSRHVIKHEECSSLMGLSHSSSREAKQSRFALTPHTTQDRRRLQYTVDALQC